MQLQFKSPAEWLSDAPPSCIAQPPRVIPFCAGAAYQDNVQQPDKARPTKPPQSLSGKMRRLLTPQASRSVSHTPSEDAAADTAVGNVDDDESNSSGASPLAAHAGSAGSAGSFAAQMDLTASWPTTPHSASKSIWKKLVPRSSKKAAGPGSPVRGTSTSNATGAHSITSAVQAQAEHKAGLECALGTAGGDAAAGASPRLHNRHQRAWRSFDLGDAEATSGDAPLEAQQLQLQQELGGSAAAASITGDSFLDAHDMGPPSCLEAPDATAALHALAAAPMINDDDGRDAGKAEGDDGDSYSYYSYSPGASPRAAAAAAAGGPSAMIDGCEGLDATLDLSKVGAY